MNHRQHYPPQSGTAGLVQQVKLHFPFPNSTDPVKSFQDFLYLSQCTQALCVKSESEHFRRGKGEPYNTMGAIYWMTNSIWQAPSKASIEYGGRWKVLHYYSKNFFNPVLVSSFENPRDSYHVHLTSDSLEKISGTVTISLWTWEGKVANSWTSQFTFGPLESKELYANNISTMLQSLKREQGLFVLEARDTKSNLLSSNVFYLSSIGQVSLPTVKVAMQAFTQVSGSQIDFQIESDQVSPFTFLETTLCGHFSNNAFLLLPNNPLTLSFFGCANVTTIQLPPSLHVHTVKYTYQ